MASHGKRMGKTLSRARTPSAGTGVFKACTLPELLARAARRHPRRPALIYFGRSLTYSDLFDQANRCAAGLQALGVRRGDRVALMDQHCPPFGIAYFGALRAGAIVTPNSPIYTPRGDGPQLPR